MADLNNHQITKAFDQDVLSRLRIWLSLVRCFHAYSIGGQAVALNRPSGLFVAGAGTGGRHWALVVLRVVAAIVSDAVDAHLSSW